MTVKNILAVSVFNSAIVSLNTAFERYDTNSDDSILIKSIRIKLKMYNEDDKDIVTATNEETAELTASEIFAASLVKDNGEYLLNYGNESIAVKKIAVKIG